MATTMRVTVYLFLCLSGISHAFNDCVQDGEVRLITSIGPPSTGRIEICRNQCFGTICTESPESLWSKKNADVACRSAGFERGAVNSILPKKSHAAGDDVPIHYSSVDCTGSESSLLDCSPSTTTTGCTHDFDATVTCISDVVQDGDIRIFGDLADERGAVEIYDGFTNRWLAICPDDTWEDQGADILCRQLGYDSGDSESFNVPPLTTSILRLTSFVCGSSGLISDCSYTPTSSCASPLLGGVNCYISPEPDGTTRLDGSTDSNRGRLEIVFRGRWGTICDTGWSFLEADVSCRQLGFDDYEDAFPFEEFTGDSVFKPVWYGSIDCSFTPDAASITQCISTLPAGFGFCSGLPVNKADVECVPSDDGGTSITGGAIFGIVFVALVVVGGGIFLINAYGRSWWAKRESYGWYRTIQHPQRSFESWWSRNVSSSTTATTTPSVTVPDPTPPAAVFELPSSRARASVSPSSSSSESEPEPGASAASPPEEHPEAKLTRGEPPSYHAARSFPKPSESSEPDEKPPLEDLPPPYPGPSQNVYPPPSAPPTGVAPYPANPVPGSYQGYPAPSNLAYPPTFDPAYPPSGSVPPGVFPYPYAEVPAEEFASAPYQDSQSGQ